MPLFEYCIGDLKSFDQISAEKTYVVLTNELKLGIL